MGMPRWSDTRLTWVVFVAAVLGTGALWHGGRTRSPEAKPAALPEARAAEPAAGSRLIVDFRDDISPGALAGNGYVEIPISDYSTRDRLYAIDFATPAEAEAARGKLAVNPDVESVDYDAVATIPPDEESDETSALAAGSMEAECDGTAAARPAGEPNDPCFRYQWHLRQLGLPDAWKLGTGKGIVVAVIDTGVTKVADLAQTKFVPGYNFLANNANADDDHGHGTHVAGTIAQSTNNKRGVAGVAPDVAIMPLKVLSARGSGSVAAIAQSIRWAADHGANVINMSLGGPMPIGTMASAVKYARAKGVVVIAAAGNDGRGKVGYPARYPGVIAVAATQFDESTTFYSNWGPEIDVAAPGGNVRVDQNGDGKPDGVLQHTIVPGNTSKTDYLWFMGTSMATPHVAGVAALIMGTGVRKPDAVEELLLGTARKPKARAAGAAFSPAAPARIDDHYGAGIVDAGAALRKARGGRGAGELGLACAFALLGVARLRRRGNGIPVGLGFVVALVAGSSGLFALPFVIPGHHAVVDALSEGFPLALANALGPVGSGNPLVWSAVAPLALVVLLYGVGRFRPALAGFAFGVAGALLFAAISGVVDVSYVPGVLDRAWLGGHAAIAALFGTAVLRKG
jgi:serine protease